MEQIKMQLNIVEDIYLEFENEDHLKIVNYALKEDLFKGKLKYNLNKNELKEWFCRRFFEHDLEVSCDDLYFVAEEKCNIRLMN